MKKFVFIALTMLLFSCSTEENNTEPINLELESSESSNIEALEQLAFNFKSIAESDNIDFSEENRTKLKKIANLILSDVKSIIEKNKLAKSHDCYAQDYANCSAIYNECIWWASNLERMMRECSGVQSAHCDQVRIDFENNIDEIEATYLRCSRELNDCTSCPGIIGPS